ncbi:MAG: tyrosinase family protein [Terriglobales bacterium]
MKCLDYSPPDSDDFRRSWRYWANIHGYYGAGTTAGTVPKNIQFLKITPGGQDYLKYYTGVFDQSPPDRTAKDTWSKCQHGTPNFLGWHRMYLYYFERVLRWAADDDTLRLPYWDYTNPAQVALPAEFRDQASPLYDPRRDALMNDGTCTLNPDSTAVVTNQVLGGNDYTTFEEQIEGSGSVHSTVHCAVGPNCPLNVPDLSYIPMAANDPIFYLHHANIDRLWACWQKLHPDAPLGDWQNGEFTFVDERGREQKSTVNEFLQPERPDYAYDNVSDCGSKPQGLVASQQFTGNGRMTAATGMTAVLGTSGESRDFSPGSPAFIPVPEHILQQFFAQPPGSASAELVLRDVRIETSPGALLNVYIAPECSPSKRRFVGTISWFEPWRTNGSRPKGETIRFDVSNQLQELKEAGSLSNFEIAVDATSGRVPAHGIESDKCEEKALMHKRPPKLSVGSFELSTPPS